MLRRCWSIFSVFFLLTLSTFAYASDAAPFKQGLVVNQLVGSSYGYLISEAEKSSTTEVAHNQRSKRIIYLNGRGATLRPGQDHSAKNTSEIAAFFDVNEIRVPAWTYSTETWDKVVACVRDVYSPFEVTVTDEDPGDQPHIEAVVGGKFSDLGLPGSPFFGLAMMDGECGVIEHSVSLNLAEEMKGDPALICWSVVQETGHAFGLDHAMLCDDPMTYLTGCGFNKTFQNREAPCGTQTEEECRCGGRTQNSVAHLTRVLGASDTYDDKYSEPETGTDGKADEVASGGGCTITRTETTKGLGLLFVLGLFVLVYSTTRVSRSKPPAKR